MYQPNAMNNYYDIGTLTHEHVSPRDVEVAVKYGPKPYPKGFPKDIKSHHFPVSILKHKLKNDDFSVRLVWSEARLALFCFHCRLFKLATSGGSSLSLIYVLYCCLKCNTVNKYYIKP